MNTPATLRKMAFAIDVAAELQAAKIAELEGRWPDARKHYELIIRNSIVPVETRLTVLRKIGRAHLQENNYDAALDVLHAALASAQEAGDQNSEAQVLNVIGIAHQTAGDLDAAAVMYDAARSAGQAVADLSVLAMIDQNAGTLASIRGDLPAALDSFRRSLSAYEALGLKDYQGQVLNNIGLVYHDMGEFPAAESAYSEALELFLVSGDRANELTVAVNQIQLWIGMKRFDIAKQQADRMVEIAESEPHPWLAEVHRHFGVIMRETGDLAAAESFFALAAAEASAENDLLLTADISEQTAELCWISSRHQQMLGHLSSARATYSRLRAERRLMDIERRNAALETRFLEIARRWGDSIEGKDHYTQGHCERVASIACTLAERSGLAPGSMFWFRLGALLHDVGKIILPFEVLNKPTPLTPAEWVLMKQHPVAGLELLADVNLPEDVRGMIRHHHERWDGAGYPDQIGGDEIPLNARILCIADVYDALTTTRAYRTALGPDVALHVMRHSDGQFDPRMLEIFLAWAEETSAA